MKDLARLCKLDKKEIKENLKDIIGIVSHPAFICSKCARVSAVDSYLCNPVAIKKPTE